MHVPPPPPPLTVAKVHRLLRPLRASLGGLSSELASHASRVSSAASLVKPSSNQFKPRSRVSAASDDDEWSDRPRKRPRISGRALGKVGMAQAKEPLTSSPPRVELAEDDSDQETLGQSSNRSMTSGASQPSAARPPFRAECAFDLVAHLKAHEFPPSIITKSLQLARAIINILQILYPSPASAKPTFLTNKRRSSSAPRSAPPSRGIPSLSELCARQIGWNIEENVRTCLEELAEAKEGAAEEALERERAQRRRREKGRSKKVTRNAVRREEKESQVAQEEDAAFFQSEWYEACPDYAHRFVLVEHAMCILLEGMIELPFAIVHAFFELVLSLGAHVEAGRFAAVLCATGLTATEPTTNAHAISLRMVECTKDSSPFFDALEKSLLESVFSDRLFYSSWLSLKRVHLSKSSPTLLRDASHVAQLLAVQVHVGYKMLDMVQDAREAGNKGGEGLLREVAAKLTSEVDAGMRLLGKARHMKHSKVEGMDDLIAAIGEVVDDFADLFEGGALGPVVGCN